MTDALNWTIALFIGDLGHLVAGLIVLMLLIELLSRLREWLP